MRWQDGGGGWGSLGVTQLMIESPLARDLQASTKIHKLDTWGKSTNQEPTSWAHHEWVEDVDEIHRGCWCFSSSPSFPPPFPSSLLSLSSSRVLPCSWELEREGEGCKWMDKGESGWRGVFSIEGLCQLVLTCGSTSTIGKQPNST